MQMGFRDMLVDAVNPALQDREGVRGHVGSTMGKRAGTKTLARNFPGWSARSYGADPFNRAHPS